MRLIKETYKSYENFSQKNPKLYNRLNLGTVIKQFPLISEIVIVYDYDPFDKSILNHIEIIIYNKDNFLKPAIKLITETTDNE